MPARTLFLPAIAKHECHRIYRQATRSKMIFKRGTSALRQMPEQSLERAPILRSLEADKAQETDAINVYVAPSAAIAIATPERALRINGPHSTRGLGRESLEPKWLRTLKSKEYGNRIDNDLIVQASFFPEIWASSIWKFHCRPAPHGGNSKRKHSSEPGNKYR